MDGAILVVAGMMVQCLRQENTFFWQELEFLLVVFINKVDLVDDAELLELVEMETENF